MQSSAKPRVGKSTLGQGTAYAKSGRGERGWDVEEMKVGRGSRSTGNKTGLGKK